MAHDITQFDHLVLTGKKAWHGLGTVVDQAPTAREALKLARMEWTIQRMPVSTMGMDGDMELTDDYRALRRSDTNEMFAVVGSGYMPIQNTQLADFVDALGASGTVKLESAGSIRAGRRVWFLARGESVWAGDRDENHTYLMLAAGHDGTLAVTCMPTSIRVVCRNTLHMALNKGKATGIRLTHEGDIRTKLDQAKRALGIYTEVLADFKKKVEALNSKEMTREQLQAFFLEVYSEVEEPIPANPKTQAERDALGEARLALAQWGRNFDKDRTATGNGATAWTAMNAVTEWFDHQRQVRAKDEAARAEARIYNKVWGSGADAKAKVMEMALATI